MAKGNKKKIIDEATKEEIKQNCSYCKYSSNPHNFMLDCEKQQYCTPENCKTCFDKQINFFEIDMMKYNEWKARYGKPISSRW